MFPLLQGINDFQKHLSTNSLAQPVITQVIQRSLNSLESGFDLLLKLLAVESTCQQHPTTIVRFYNYFLHTHCLLVLSLKHKIPHLSNFLFLHNLLFSLIRLSSQQQKSTVYNARSDAKHSVHSYLPIVKVKFLQDQSSSKPHPPPITSLGQSQTR